MVFLGVCGIRDPPREGTAPSMRQAAAAGIRVMMITGDGKDTAIAIARSVGLFPPGEEDHVLAGDATDHSTFTTAEFFSLDRESQLEALRRGNKVSICDCVCLCMCISVSLLI